MMATFATICLLSVIYLLGTVLAFTDGGEYQPYIGGLSKAMLAGVTKDSLRDGAREAVLGDAGKHRLAEAADVGLVFAAVGEGE